ncbi:MAG: glycerate kinase [Rhodospirillales bacterium]
MDDHFLKELFAAAIAAADPLRVLPAHLPPAPRGRAVVAGFGKASARMAQALEAHWTGPLEGIAITRYGHEAPCRRIEIVTAAHPVPDAQGEAAARRIVDFACGLKADDVLVCLVSGGGSSLLAVPAPGLTLADKQSVNAALLKSGAAISEMNCVRKHLSAVKGGRLAAAAHPAPVVTLAISDVPGDDPAVIASGPTVADPTTFADARAIVARYGIDLPAAVVRYLAAAEEETPKPNDPRLARAAYTLIATPARSLRAAAEIVRAHGFERVFLGDAMEGDAEAVGGDHARDALARVGRGPCVLLSSGETTVTVRGAGRGGRNGQYLLALAVAAGGHPAISAIAGDTDGIDGTEDNAGAVVRPDTLARARALGLDPLDMLAKNDSYGFFEALGDLVVTGPTLTNVNDFRAVLIGR